MKTKTWVSLCLGIGMAAGSGSLRAAIPSGTDVEKMENAAKVYQEILESINNTTETIPKIEAPTRSGAPQEAQRFLSEIRFEIQESIEYPAELRGKGLRAKVLVEFWLNPDGTLKEVAVRDRTPGLEPAFETGALNAVRRAVEFFPPLPNGFNAEVKFKVPIIFEDA